MVVPARKVDAELLRKGVKVIESWGLKIKMGRHCFSADNHYLAASDEARMADFQSMLDDDKVQVIFCARGGYGTTRIVDQLNFEKFLQKPKWIIGFSDITALHLKLHQLGAESIHGCMPVQFSKPEYDDSVEDLRKILFQERRISITAQVHECNRIGEATGQVIGGNLSLIADSMGTPTAPDTNGKILVIEEVDEYYYKIDRMMIQLKRAGKLSQLAGLVVGHMTDILDTELPFNQEVEELILDKVREYGYPVAFHFPMGHEAPNFAWIHSAKATLTVSMQESVLSFR